MKITKLQQAQKIAERIVANPRSSPDARAMAASVLHQSVIHPVALPVKSMAMRKTDPKKTSPRDKR